MAWRKALNLRQNGPLQKVSAKVVFWHENGYETGAVRGFDMIADLAHAGETLAITHDGKPWIKLVSALKAKPGRSAATFKARLKSISQKPIPGASEALQRLRR